MELMGSAT